MRVNLRKAYPNLERAYEIAKVAGVKMLIVFPGDDLLSEESKDEKYDIPFYDRDRIRLTFAVIPSLGKERFVIFPEITRLDFDQLELETDETSKKESDLRIYNAVQRQVVKTFENEGTCKSLMKTAFQRLNLSITEYSTILEVSEAIARLDGESSIMIQHVAEAIQYISVPQHVKEYVINNPNR